MISKRDIVVTTVIVFIVAVCVGIAIHRHNVRQHYVDLENQVDRCVTISYQTRAWCEIRVAQINYDVQHQR